MTTGLGAKKLPEPGDCTLCFTCTKPGIFLDDLSLRKPTEEELDDIYADPIVARFRQLRHEL